MKTNIFVNLPVKDLSRSVDFFKKLGFSINSQFTDETAACVVISDTIYAMILTHEKFKQFTKKQIADSATSTEVITAVSAECREEVDDFVRRAVEAGGKTHREPEDHGWMYGQSIEDLDGHIWEFFWMDEDKVQP
jgi:predicted lactoylglutathione lyase